MAGTSTGAKKGWLTRRGYARFGGSAMHTRKQELLTVEESARLRKMRGGKAAPAPAPRATRPAPAAPARAPLTPVGRVDASRLDPYAPPDPHALRELYGDQQLGRALDRYSMDKVSQAAARVGVRPGRNKQETIGRIVAHVTGATRPAPAAPARPRSDAGYAEFVQEFERRNARGVNFGPTSAQAYANAHRGHMARYRAEHPQMFERPAPAAPARPAANVDRLRKQIDEQEARVRDKVQRSNAAYDLNEKALYQNQQTNERTRLAQLKARLAKAEGRKLNPGEASLTSDELARGLGRNFPTAAPAKSSGPVKGKRVKMGREPVSSGASLAPGNAPDLEALRRNFSVSERAATLRKYSMGSLRKGVADVLARRPDARKDPPRLSNKDEMVYFLMKYGM